MMRAGAVEKHADQLSTAQQLTTGLLTLARRGTTGELQRVVAGAAGQAASAFTPAVLRATQAANPTVALADLSAQLHDRTWAQTPADQLLGAHRIGVGSMGSTTRAVLAAVSAGDRNLPDIVVPNLATARGLGYLELRILTGEIAEADALLVSGVAAHGATVWTSTAIADAAIRASVRGRLRVAAVHPVAHLDQTTRAGYQPPPGVVPVDL